MDRRNDENQTGYIQWPTGSPYQNSGEGGLHVWLVVLDDVGEFITCCGPTAYLHSSEVNIPLNYSDDRWISSGSKGAIIKDSWEPLEVEQALEIGAPVTSQRYCEQAARIFPDIYDRSDNTNWAERTRSAPLLASVCLGTTGGSWYREGEGYFCATLEDLTQAGKDLYNLLQKLYDVPHAQMHLLTTLDT